MEFSIPLVLHQSRTKALRPEQIDAGEQPERALIV